MFQGFGKTENDDFPNVLLEATVKTLSNEECRQWIHDNVTSSTIRQSMSCGHFSGHTHNAHQILSPHAPCTHVRLPIVCVCVRPMLFARTVTSHNSCFGNRRKIETLIETSISNGINDVVLCTHGIKNKVTNCYSVSTYHIEIGQGLLKKEYVYNFTGNF